MEALRTDSKYFLYEHQSMKEIYITCFLQILNFSSRFRQFEMKNFLRRPTMAATIQYFIIGRPPPRISTGLSYLLIYFYLLQHLHVRDWNHGTKRKHVDKNIFHFFGVVLLPIQCYFSNFFSSLVWRIALSY